MTRFATRNCSGRGCHAHYVMPQTFRRENLSMPTDAVVAPNVKQAVPFFMVTDIEASLHFYVDGLGFAVTNEWRPEKASGRIQWCRLQLGNAAVMLQEYWRDGSPGGAPEGPHCSSGMTKGWSGPLKDAAAQPQAVGHLEVHAKNHQQNQEELVARFVC
jgi:catechol 2,3-dioxygenase-like lactoylglutathione lyase family enzyme